MAWQPAHYVPEPSNTQLFDPREPPPPFAQPPADAALAARITKLADYIARNGPQFLQLIRTKQASNPDYAFLDNGTGCDYYQWFLYCTVHKMDPHRNPVQQPLYNNTQPGNQPGQQPRVVGAVQQPLYATTSGGVWDVRGVQGCAGMYVCKLHSLPSCANRRTNPVPIQITYNHVQYKSHPSLFSHSLHDPQRLQHVALSSHPTQGLHQTLITRVCMSCTDWTITRHDCVQQCKFQQCKCQQCKCCSLCVTISTMSCNCARIHPYTPIYSLIYTPTHTQVCAPMYPKHCNTHIYNHIHPCTQNTATPHR